MPHENPASKTEMSIRLSLVKELVVKGMTQREIVRFLKEKHNAEWGLSDRWLRTYVHMAKQRLAKAAPQIDLDEEFMIAKLRNDLLFNSSYKIQDNKTALSANISNIKLMELDSPRFKKSWREKFASAGLDPDDTMNQFVEMLQAEAEKKNANQ